MKDLLLPIAIIVGWYDGNPAESFPFNQAKERWSMWLLKKYVLPVLYWSGMLKGRA
jgi:sulfide:quinone oxidoreductase